MQAAGGQVRVAPMGGVVSFDMTAVLAMARARGVPQAAVAELIPYLEAVMVAKMQAQTKDGRGDGRIMGDD